jgi:hypothetical protein
MPTSTRAATATTGITTAIAVFPAVLNPPFVALGPSVCSPAEPVVADDFDVDVTVGAEL